MQDTANKVETDGRYVAKGYPVWYHQNKTNASLVVKIAVGFNDGPGVTGTDKVLALLKNPSQRKAQLTTRVSSEAVLTGHVQHVKQRRPSDQVLQRSSALPCRFDPGVLVVVGPIHGAPFSQPGQGVVP